MQRLPVSLFWPACIPPHPRLGKFLSLIHLAPPKALDGFERLLGRCLRLPA
jgi:hypothetical protein